MNLATNYKKYNAQSSVQKSNITFSSKESTLKKSKSVKHNWKLPLAIIPIMFSAWSALASSPSRGSDGDVYKKEQVVSYFDKIDLFDGKKDGKTTIKKLNWFFGDKVMEVIKTITDSDSKDVVITRKEVVELFDEIDAADGKVEGIITQDNMDKYLEAKTESKEKSNDKEL